MVDYFSSLGPQSPLARDTTSGVTSAPDYAAAAELHRESPTDYLAESQAAEGDGLGRTATYGRASTQNHSLEQARYSDKQGRMSPKSVKMMSTLDERLATVSGARQHELRGPSHQFSTYAPQRIRLQDRAATVSLLENENGANLGSKETAAEPKPVVDLKGEPAPKGKKNSTVVSANRDLS